MNPFDLDDSYFLVFYGLLGAVSYFFLRFYVAHREGRSPIPKLKFNDPFEIAFLRGNKNETIRIASLSLIDRGLLEIYSSFSSTPELVTRYPGDINLGKSRIECALLRLFPAAGRPPPPSAMRSANARATPIATSWAGIG